MSSSWPKTSADTMDDRLLLEQNKCLFSTTAVVIVRHVKNDRKKQYELVSSKIQTDGNGKETTEGRKEGETNYLTHFIYGNLGNNRKTLAHS